MEDGIEGYPLEDLIEARRQIASLLAKLEKTAGTLRGKQDPHRLKSQITLAERRIKALTIACALIDERMDGADGATAPRR